MIITKLGFKSDFEINMQVDEIDNRVDVGNEMMDVVVNEFDDDDEFINEPIGKIMRIYVEFIHQSNYDGLFQRLLYIKKD